MRAAIPDLALTTDLIVGFPGETDDGLPRRRVAAVEEVGFDGAFTFVFSPRGRHRGRRRCRTRSPRSVKRERIERLIEVVQRSAAERNAERVGGVEEVLVEGPSRTDPARPARPHAPQHDRQLHRQRRQPASSSRSGSRRDLDDPARRAGRPRRRVVASSAISSGTAASTSAISAACRPRTAAETRFGVGDPRRHARPAHRRRLGGARSASGVTRIVDLREQYRDRQRPAARPRRRGRPRPRPRRTTTSEHWLEIQALQSEAATHARVAATEIVYLRFLEHCRPRFVRGGRGGRDRWPRRRSSFHCHGGKDRTGLVAALLLRLAGVRSRTSPRTSAQPAYASQPRHEQWLASAESDEERARIERIAATPGDGDAGACSRRRSTQQLRRRRAATCWRRRP